MDDIVGRLLRELPDTDKDRYDIAYQRGRAQVRSSLFFGGLTVGMAAGATALFFLDPRQGRGRRIELRQRLEGMVNQLRQTIESRRSDVGNRAFGAATELGLPGTPPSNAERRAVDATTAVRTQPRSAAAPRTSTSSTDREPVGAATPDR